MAADFEGTEFDDNKIDTLGMYQIMRGKGGDDQLGTNSGFARIYGGSGDDGLNYYGDGNSKLYGNSGDDYLYGGGQNDKFYGGGGDDWMFGLDGKNIYKTGGGRDHIVFGTTPDDKLDKGKDFNPKKDYLNFNPFYFPVGLSGLTLDESQFRKGGKAKDADDNFGYNPNNGNVWFDENGNAPGGFHKIIKLDEDLHISYMNFQF
jgi:Ca2+-binding RTX toxin-like protein